MPLSRAERELEIGTPLGDDVLLLVRFSGTECLSRPFAYELELLSEDHEIDFSAIIAQPVVVRLTVADDGVRYFHGYVARFAQVGRAGSFSKYSATVVPWIWFLSRSVDCRIFQKQTVPDIVEQVMAGRGFNTSDMEQRLSKAYRPWDYCVQYRESDLDFLSRLMEHEGIFYFHRHAQDGCKLVLADSPTGHEEWPGYEDIPYRPEQDESMGFEHISQWVLRREVQPTGFALDAFDFTTPPKELGAASSVGEVRPGPQYEVFDYPGGYTEYGDGEAYARIRMEELQVQYQLVSGRSDARGLTVGYTFNLIDHPRQDQCKQHLVTSATYRATTGDYEAGTGPGAGETQYVCEFTAIDAETPFRPPRTTPKPFIRGPQTALVVGPSGQEIHTDQYGRVKVQFHWDRYSSSDENSSCWVRVAQVWAGTGWGGMLIPRVGQEVVVEFLNGDPDCPIITGRVYNGTNLTPYPLPDEATVSTLRSNSSPGGGGANELRFEDKSGEEQIYVHAQRDHGTRVENDTREWVGANRHLIVTADQLEKVDGDKHLTVGGDQNEKVAGTVSLDAGGDLQQKVGGNYAVEASGATHLKAGSALVIEATAVTLKAGASFVVVDSSGVSVMGTTVKINSGGAAGAGAGCSPQAPAEPEKPEVAGAGQADQAPAEPQPPAPTSYSPAATVLQQGAASGAPFCEVCEAAKQEQTAGTGGS
jgi:type VI secretion system secreted protein VgrG